ncbi:cell division/environmental response transcriptional regulator [Mycobacterium tuberculosis]|uniref:cell division/environmental response transcriptional regulator n=2 Tax=Mycobacterium tuberculosis TaxID=1773 RepID=UPI0005E75507|nr:cell division/environmental response transcriptional regulator [Mycobacterium tuberculosis]CKO86900.1 DNA-binding protein [Mycobacterium tuberculosis]
MTSTNGPSARDTVFVEGQQKKTQLLTVAEVAALMRVSKMTVYRLVHNGELPAVRVGRSFRVHAKAVHDMLETSYFDAG